MALTPFAIIQTLTYLTILAIFRPHRSARVNLDAVRLQRALLGPLTKDEVGSAVVLVALCAGDHTFVGYVNSGYPMTYFASEGELFSHAQARWPLMLESLYRIVGLLASVPVWRLMGMM